MFRKLLKNVFCIFKIYEGGITSLNSRKKIVILSLNEPCKIFLLHTAHKFNAFSFYFNISRNYTLLRTTLEDSFRFKYITMKLF